MTTNAKQDLFRQAGWGLRGRKSGKQIFIIHTFNYTKQRLI